MIHHIAFATPDDATQADVRAELIRSGQGVSGVRDRQYFHSIYFQEPNGILFEVATEGPGFLIDEPERDEVILHLDTVSAGSMVRDTIAAPRMPHSTLAPTPR